MILANFSPSTLVHKSPFLRQKEYSDHFWLKRNFVGHEKLNLYGVLKMHIFPNQRRYKSCPKFTTNLYKICKFLHFYLLPLPDYCHFWDRRSAPITFGHSNNFVGHKKLNLYGVLKIHFFQNQRRYKSCTKTPTISYQKGETPISTNHPVKIVVYYILFLRWPMMMLTDSYDHFAIFLKSHPSVVSLLASLATNQQGSGLKPRPRVAGMNFCEIFLAC